MTAQEAGHMLEVPAAVVLREHRLGVIPGRRLSNGRIGFRWSEIVEVWDGRRQLSFEDDAA